VEAPELNPPVPKKFLSWMISHADAAWHLMLLLFIIAVVLPELFYYVGLNYTSFFCFSGI